MGIRFLCPACDKKVHVKDHQAGLRGFCPKCGARIDIPLHSTLLSKGRRGTDPGKVRHPSVAPGAAGEQTIMSLLPPTGRLLSMTMNAPPDPLGELPQFQWYVVPQGGAEPFGPADGRLMNQWMQEGRIVARSMVWRQDWPNWRKAGAIWSQLVLADVEASPTSKLQRAAAAVPQFTAPNVPSMPFAAAPSANVLLPQRALPGVATGAAPHTAPQSEPPGGRRHTAPPAAASSSERTDADLDYLRRGRRRNLWIVLVLIVLTAGMAVVLFQVLKNVEERKEAAPAGDAEPADVDGEPNATEGIEP